MTSDLFEPTGSRGRRGPFRVGDRVQLTDPKKRMHTITLEAGKQFHTAKGALEHDDLIGRDEGIVVTSTQGTSVSTPPLRARTRPSPEIAGPATGSMRMGRRISPRAVVNLGTCNDATSPPGLLGMSVNGQFASAIMGHTLNIVDVFRPLDASATATPFEVQLNADCTAGTPDSCMPAATMPSVVATQTAIRRPSPAPGPPSPA